jgi:integrase/recombinase XerC
MQQLTICELIQLFDVYNLGRGKRPATCHWHVSALKQFADFAGEQLLAGEITELVADRYRADLVKRGLAVESVNTYLRSLKALLRWAYRKHYLESPITVELMLTDPPEVKESFDPDEFQLLLEACEKEATHIGRLRAKAIIMLLYSSGMRASELIQARWNNIREQNGVHVLNIKAAKRGKMRTVPLANSVWAAISAYRKALEAEGFSPVCLFASQRNHNDPLTVSGLRQLCDRLENRSGIHANPHMYRRAFASWWLNEGKGDIETLMKIGGWQDRETVFSHYAALKTETLVQAHSRYSPLTR